MAPESVRRRSEEPEVARPETGEPAFSVGDAVDARYRGRAKTYPGAIERVHEDATYDILYEDGEREARVAEALISKRALFAVGAAVEANYRGKGTYYPGQITALNDDGTFGVLYDDGEGELGVPAALVRARTAAAPAPAPAPAPSPSKKRPQTPKEPLDESNAPLSPGMAVEARFRGRGKIYKGKVVKIVDFGAFVNFFGKRDGLVHVSQIENRRLNHPSDVLKEGQEVWVKLLGFDDRGKVRLAMKMVDQETGEERAREEAEE